MSLELWWMGVTVKENETVLKVFEKEEETVADHTLISDSSIPVLIYIPAALILPKLN